MQAKCVICGNDFEGKNTQAKYCCDAERKPCDTRKVYEKLRDYEDAQERGRQVEKRELSNADHIREMTNVELYSLLSRLNFDECECPARGVCHTAQSCGDAFMEWLSQPYKEKDWCVWNG